MDDHVLVWTKKDTHLIIAKLYSTIDLLDYFVEYIYIPAKGQMM